MWLCLCALCVSIPFMCFHSIFGISLGSGKLVDFYQLKCFSAVFFYENVVEIDFDCTYI